MVDVAERADENKDIVIGIVNDTEFEAWLCLWQQYISFYEADVPEHITRKTWQRFSEPEEPVFCAVARQGDQIVGLVHYLFQRSTWSESYYCYLEDLFVRPDMRGKHIGKRLIDFVRLQACIYPASRLYWHTHEMNLRGQRLYDQVAVKSGMIEYRMSS